MIDPKNVVSLQGNLAAEPEIINDKIFKAPIAINYGGSEDGKSTTGYFDLVYYLNQDSNSTFVRNQVSSGNLSKGSSVTILGRLTQDRFVTKDGQKAYRVKVTVESLTYSGSAKNNDSNNTSATQNVETVTAQIPDAW